MARFLIRRAFWAIFLFFVASMATYLIFFVIPSDPAEMSAGHILTPQIFAHIRHELHLDLPI